MALPQVNPLPKQLKQLYLQFFILLIPYASVKGNRDERAVVLPYFWILNLIVIQTKLLLD
jgi:hypothetical protein